MFGRKQHQPILFKELDHSVPDRYPNFRSIWNQRFVLCRFIRSITNYQIMPSKYPNSQILETQNVVGRLSADMGRQSADTTKKYCKPVPSDRRPSQTIRYEVYVMPAHCRACQASSDYVEPLPLSADSRPTPQKSTLNPYPAIGVRPKPSGMKCM